jgi:hypothetical protein
MTRVEVHETNSVKHEIGSLYDTKDQLIFDITTNPPFHCLQHNMLHQPTLDKNTVAKVTSQFIKLTHILENFHCLVLDQPHKRQELNTSSLTKFAIINSK